MLLRFNVSNFLSISEELEFNMFPYSKLRTHQHHVYATPQVDLLKSAAIYGANGSGKSNLVRALHYLHDIVVEKELDHPEYSALHFKLDESCAGKPTCLEVEFKQGERYLAYGVQVFNGEILEEWLYMLEVKNEKDVLIFNRVKDKNGRIQLEVTPAYQKTEKERLLIQLYAEEILDHRTPFIHQVHEKEQYPEIRAAYQWFRDKLFVIYPISRYTDLVSKIIDNKSFRDFTNDVMPKLDTGIAKVAVEKVPFDIFFGEDDKELKADLREQFKKGAERVVLQAVKNQVAVVKEDDGELYVHKIVTRHRSKNGSAPDFQLEEESDGTRRLFDLLPALELIINQEVVFFIDEIGRSLHPALLKAFLRLFLSRKTRGQLIFTTHESNLLDLKLFRQDEVWFMEKDETGSSRAYPLSEFKPRYDLDIRKGYLNGRFGAIPFLGNLKDLNWEYAEEEQRV
ncbi:MAG: ATP-binding protein [Lewinellaceae bacterium]|nr:ATP-binding protein [Lewinellaceae bacterium]